MLRIAFNKFHAFSSVAARIHAHRHEASASGLSAISGLVSSFGGSEEVIDDEIRHFAAQTLAGGEVGAEMHASENPA